MSALRRLPTILVLALLLPAVPASEAGAQAKAKGKIVLTGGFVYHSEVVQPGATVLFKVSCPPPNRALSGTVSSADPKVLSLLSVPAAGGKAWSFGFRNTDTKAQTVVVVVNCATPPAPFGLPPGKLKGAKVVLVKAGGVSKIKVVCPPGQTAVGDGTQSTSSLGKSAGSVGGTQVTAVEPSGRSVSVGLRNPGPLDEEVKVGARCLPKRVESRGERASLGFSHGTFNEQVPPGGSVVSGGCPGGLPLLAGFSLPADGQVGFVGSGFRNDAFSTSWALSNSSKLTASAQVTLLCVAGRIKFVRGLPGGSVGTIDTTVGPITIVG